MIGHELRFVVVLIVQSRSLRFFLTTTITAGIATTAVGGAVDEIGKTLTFLR